LPQLDFVQQGRLSSLNKTMKHHRYLLLLFLALSGLFVIACGKDTVTEITTLNVVATGNIWGEIEPCG
jgi:hypothetical protein